MKARDKQKGPWMHRFFIYFFSGLFTLLLIWLLGFVQRDISKMPGPDYQAIEDQYIDQSLRDQLEAVKKQSETLQRQINNQREIQDILRNSTNNSQQTMNQLLGMHRHNIEQGVKPTEAEQNALAESEKIFLENQKKFQEANQEIAQLSQNLRTCQENIQSLQDEIQEKRKPAQEEYNEALKSHNFMIASLKLAVLLPLLLLASWFAIKKRQTAYTPIIYSSFIAVFWRVFLVMHEHFPKEFFKYIAICAAILIVLAFLIHLIRQIVSPKKDWLLKQYKESYTRHLCPICSYPIERGPLKYMLWTSKGPKIRLPMQPPENHEEEQPYVCPSCGSSLYEHCKECNAIRPSLLPYCQSCGAEKTID
ncbi:MAG: hypothetical protein ACP5I1_03915 [Candidatus Hinthialibacter sp.]